MAILLYRLAPQGAYAVSDGQSPARFLLSDPLATPPAEWRYGGPVEIESLLSPVRPGKIVGVGRNYREHAKELGNPMPAEPLLFLKAPSAVVGPQAPVVLPPESGEVSYEGEIAVVLGRRLRRAGADEARQAILGVTCANDVTARDLQQKDRTFARAKSFDSFCPLGPAIWVGADVDDLTVVTRVNGDERQRGATRGMAFGIVELLVYASRMMTLEPGDVVLTGTPAGVGLLSPGDVVEVEIPGLGVLANPVEAYRAV